MTFNKGTHVKLGDGREGVIVGKRERVGFSGYIVKITKSVDPDQIGSTVGASPDGMKVATILPVPMQQSQQTDTQEQDEQQQLARQKITEEEKKRLELVVKSLKDQTTNAETQLTLLRSAQMTPSATSPAVVQKQQSDAMQVTQDIENENDAAQENLSNLTQNQAEHRQDEQLAQQELSGVQNMMTQQQQQTKTAAHWIKSERAGARVIIKNAGLICDVAVTPKQQSSGLQAYDDLSYNHGLWFPFYSRRTASFHMGEVKFPIDIIFVDGNKVAKIVSKVLPRKQGSWSSTCTDVIETNGGWAEDHYIKVGDTVETPVSPRVAANTYDVLRSITEASPEDEGLSFEEREQQILEVFPFLKSAQEVGKPSTTDRRVPGEVDKRNPETRFHEGHTPDTGPLGQDRVETGMPGSNSPELNFGYDPLVESDVAIRPAASKIANSLKWFDEGARGYEEMAVISDATISDVDKLQIGASLHSNEIISAYELLGSDLVVYR